MTQVYEVNPLGNDTFNIIDRGTQRDVFDESLSLDELREAIKALRDEGARPLVGQTLRRYLAKNPRSRLNTSPNFNIRRDWVGTTNRRAEWEQWLEIGYCADDYEGDLLYVSNRERLSEDFGVSIGRDGKVDLDAQIADLDGFVSALEGLENYPLYDDDDHSRREFEAFGEEWETDIRRDVERYLENRFGLTFSLQETGTEQRALSLASERASRWNDVCTERDVCERLIEESGGDAEFIADAIEEGAVRDEHGHSLVPMLKTIGPVVLADWADAPLAKLLGFDADGIECRFQSDGDDDVHVTIPRSALRIIAGRWDKTPELPFGTATDAGSQD